MKENFKTIKFAKKYKISGNGRIVNKETGLEVKPQLGSTGYHHVRLSMDTGKFKTQKIHRLVALAFLPNPEGKRTINHKDGDKLNNELPNLEWATDKENSHHARTTGLCNQSIGVKATNIDTGEELVFDSRGECANYFGSNKHNISRALHKRDGYYKSWRLVSLGEYKYPTSADYRNKNGKNIC